MNVLPLLVAGAIATLVSLPTSAGAQTVDDRSLGYPEFRDMTYPDAALRTRTQGVVVVAVLLNQQGAVTDVTALSGPRVLVPSVVDNARRWEFQPNPQNRAILAYEFRIEGVCKAGSTLFSRLHSNFVRVVACLPAEAPVERATSLATAGSQLDATVFDEDLSRLSFEDLKYPRIALAANVSGLVVVETALDATGHVAEARVLSGHPMLTADAIDNAVTNARTWTFRPRSQKRVIIVYNFEFQGLCETPQSTFRLLHVNFASVMGCRLGPPLESRAQNHPFAGATAPARLCLWGTWGGGPS